MPKRVDFQTQRDFTGGLNLTHAQLQLRDEETPDLLNVDVDPRGGFGLRRGIKPYHAEVLAGVGHSVLPFTRSTGESQALVGVGTALYRHTGAAWASIFTGGPAGPYRSVTFKDRIYIFSGNNAVRRWDGTTLVSTTDPAVAGYNDNLAAPTAFASTGDVPKAKVAATYQGSVFVGNIVENATAYPNRIRWSHPLFPEDWRTNDYIDIEQEDGDEITALVPLEDRLLVFKHRSVHAIYGAPPESLSVTAVSRELGAPTQEAVVGTDLGVMFWHEGSGAHLLSGDVLRGTKRSWIGERIWPAIEDNSVILMDDVQVGWLNRRLWVSVPWDGSATRSHCFVYDPFCGKDGAWTFYDTALGPFLSLPTSGLGNKPLALSASTAYLLQVDNFDFYYDNYGTGIVPIASHYTTRWWDSGEPAVKKRWKRPVFVVLAGQDATIPVEVLRDYDPSTFSKSFNITTVAPALSGVWDSDNWDDAMWAAEDVEANTIERGSPLGNAVAVALKVNGPTTGVPWRVDALTMKWISKRVRN